MWWRRKPAEDETQVPEVNPFGDSAFSLSEFQEMDRDRHRVLEEIGWRLSPPKPPEIQVVGDLPLKVVEGRVVDNPFVFLAEMENQGLLNSLNPKEGRVLDFSSGLGRNALYMIKKGFDVLSVAYHLEEKHFQRKWAERYAGRIPNCGRLEVAGGSLRSHELWNEKFIFVICTNSLQNAPLDVGEKVVREFQDWTKPNGLNLITAWTFDDPKVEEGIREWSEKIKGQFVTSGGSDDRLQELYSRGWIHYGSGAGIRRPWSFDPSVIKVYSAVIARKT